MLQKLLEKVFITNKFIQCKTSRTLTTDVFGIPDNQNITRNIWKLLSKYELFLLNKANFSSDLSQILILQFPYLDLPWLLHNLCQILCYPTETLLQHSPHHVLYGFLYFVLPHLTTPQQKYWIYQTICQAHPNKFSIKLYTDLNTLWVKHTTHQKVESLGTASLSKLDNTVNLTTFIQPYHTTFPKTSTRNPSLYLSQFSTPCSTLTCCKIILTIPINTPSFYNSTNFHVPIFLHNHPNNLHQKFFSLP